MSTGRLAFQLGYQVSPILFTGGLAANIPGGVLPIIALTQAASFVQGLLQGSVDINPDNYFAQFQPLSGGTLANNQIGMYPFANQATAANAIIAQPLNISLEMFCPSRQAGDQIGRLVTLTALKAALDNHTAQGGTFTVATPSYIYTNLILISLRDITPQDSKQKQTYWQWDFVKPLVAQSDAQNAFGSLMGKIAGGLPITGDPTWSGALTSVGSSISNAVSSVIPSASNLIGSAAGGSTISQGIDFLSGSGATPTGL